MIPPKLKVGDEIRIIAPSRSISILSKELIQEATTKLEDLGLKVTFAKHVKKSDDFDSSSIKSRINDLHEAFKDKNNVKVVVDKNNDALYFSREPIPSLWKESENVPHYMQTGIISFRRDALYNFNNTSETMLERVESIDLNRILESGNKVRMIPTDKLTIGVDTPDELKNAEKILLSDPIFKLYS